VLTEVSLRNREAKKCSFPMGTPVENMTKYDIVDSRLGEEREIMLSSFQTVGSHLEVARRENN
jgi:hypothetical protein